MLFWKDLTHTLTCWGLDVSPYDWCVANKTIEGKHCTVLWHIYGIKISHVNKDVVSSVIDYLSYRYGKEAPLTVTRGKIHQYLGMPLNYSAIGKVQIKMSVYIKDILESLPPRVSVQEYPNLSI